MGTASATRVCSTAATVRRPNRPTITFTASPADAQALHDGTLDLSVGFMRGQVKMAGDFGALLRFLPTTGGTAPTLRPADLLPG